MILLFWNIDDKYSTVEVCDATMLNFYSTGDHQKNHKKSSQS